MSEDIIVVGIVFGSVVAIVVCTLLYKLIKSSISDSTYDEEDFNRMAQAFIEYKKETERRLESLEDMVGNEEKNKSSQRTLDQSEQINIEEPSPQQQEPNEENKLKNILKE